MPSILETELVSVRLDGFKPARLDLQNQQRPATAIPLESPTLSSKSSPGLRRRRSVASMKGLMPLALSPSSASLRSYQSDSTEESMGEPVAKDCFPELLAQDLDASTAIFAAKKMTSGTPMVGLSSEDRSRARASRMVLFSPYLAVASANVRSLGAIEERESLVSFLENTDAQFEEEHTSASESVTGSDSFDDVMPPSFRHRASVVTTATSVASAGYQHKTSHPELGRTKSWIDNDSEPDEDEPEQVDNTACLSPRPPTPPSSDLGSPTKMVHTIKDTPSIWKTNPTVLHRKSHSVSGGSPVLSARRQISELSLITAARPSTTAGKLVAEVRDLEIPARVPERSSSVHRVAVPQDTIKPMRTAQHKRSSPALGRPPTPQVRIPYEFKRKPLPLEDDYPESELESISPAAQPLWTKSNTEFVRPPSPPALRSVQSWLNNSLQPYPWAHQAEEASNVVPLPPDVMETLRVSVACFPETMLLSSSLTTETIRSYGRKMRHHGTEAASSVFTPDPVPPGPRKSLWRKVVTYKRGPQLPEPRGQTGYSSSQYGSTANMSMRGVVEPPKAWLPLKNVFGGFCSDYICDALYAHILAYNYVSALVARNPSPMPPQASRRGSSQQDDIPRKAASLLGLSGVGEMRPSRRVSTPLGDWARESSMSSNQDTALRSVQGGLLRCIARLTATAKLMAESGSGEERMVDMEVEDSDMLFTRSLCEIVRMAEEAA